MRKLYVGIGIVLILSTGLLIFNNQKQTAERYEPNESNITTETQHRNLDECVETAELDYRVYMIMNTDGFKDINGTTVYNLPEEKMSEQNTKRANAIDACYKSF